ncbi:8-oxoguanine DNA glycosylase OGG fold protein [Amycolatopsis magusensis]|uniref:8-oxoguanine DNA glycosylase OGG fold protein n=1 Tax=Amycolatopsis magusensis TaxID=882444 RepID=UPI00378ED67D
MPTTDLALPGWAIPAQSRAIAVAQHTISIRTQWWNHAITSRGLPGTPPAGDRLSRAEVWSAADDVFTLLWRALAWGSGHYLRNNTRRLDSIREKRSPIEDVLTEARELSRHNPAAAYTLLRPVRRNVIPWLGPAFFTKFLYFAGGGAPEHPCLILDSVVAMALRDHAGWKSLPTGNWSAQTYQRYCDLLARWARRHGRAPDELERALFRGRPKDLTFPAA